MEDSYKNSHKRVKIVQNVQKLQLDKKVSKYEYDTINTFNYFFVYLAYELNHRLFFFVQVKIKMDLCLLHRSIALCYNVFGHVSKPVMCTKYIGTSTDVLATPSKLL